MGWWGCRGAVGRSRPLRRRAANVRGLGQGPRARGSEREGAGRPGTDVDGGGGRRRAGWVCRQRKGNVVEQDGVTVKCVFV